MSTTVDELPIIRSYTDLVSDKSQLTNSVLNNEDGQYFEQLTDRLEPSPYLIYGNVKSGAPIVIWFGHQQSPLRRKLIQYLTAHDIILILFLIEEYLWQWLDLNRSPTVISLILQPTINSQELIRRSHSYTSIRSILVHCANADLINLERFSRAYPKVDGIYNDDRRLLIKLVFDVMFFSEELGDHQIEDENNGMEGQRNYDRALKLCAYFNSTSSNRLHTTYYSFIYYTFIKTLVKQNFIVLNFTKLTVIAAAVILRMDLAEVLFVGSETITDGVVGLRILLFAQILDLIKHVDDNVTLIDRFVLIVPGQAGNALLTDIIYKFQQARQIYLYYDNDHDLKQDESRIDNKDGKLRFCHKRNLRALIEKLNVDTTINVPESNYQETVDNVTSSWEQRISAKRQNAARHLTTPKRFASPLKYGYSIRNIDQVNSHYICSSCKFLFRDPHQLQCGHRICKTCIKTENTHTTCLTCYYSSSNEFIWADHGFHKDMLPLSVSCSSCTWTGCLEVYQKHIDQKHPDGENNPPIRDGYTQQMASSRLRERICHAAENSLPFLLMHLQEVIRASSNRVNTVSNDQRRIATDFQRIETSYQAANQNFFSIKEAHEDNLSYADGLRLRQDLYDQQIWSLQQAVHNASSTSHNGVYTWKITNVHEKIVDARSERQKSIYSPPFYSSGNGYKICLRLYLNGDSVTRGKYLSLFFVLMKNDDDPILRWPFPYAILFRLINQTTPNDTQHHITHFVRPDTKSSCFQRPIVGMNEPYGVKEFLSIEQFEQNQNDFVIDDTMFIEAKIDFLNENSWIPSSVGGVPNDAEHVGTIHVDIRQLS